MEIVIDYIWSNKYILIALGVLTLVSFVQWWRFNKVKRKLEGLLTWSTEIYEYLQRR